MCSNTSRQLILFTATVVVVATAPALTREALAITVTTAADTCLQPYPAGGLRQAIFDANRAPGRDTITFAAGVSSISLACPLIPVTDEIEWFGGPELVATSATWQGAMVTFAGSQRLTSFKVVGLRLVGGPSGIIGVELLQGALALEQARITKMHYAPPPGMWGTGGAGIHISQGDLTLTEVRITSNLSEVFGGALYNESNDNVIIVERSTFDRNQSVQDGGAVFSKGGTLLITDSTFSRNAAGGFYGGVITVVGQPSQTASVDMINTTVSENFGGSQSASLALVEGAQGSLKTQLINCTIFNNHPWGMPAVLHTDGGSFRALNTILVGDGTQSPLCSFINRQYHADFSGEGNILEDSSCVGLPGIVNPSPGLLPLAGNGGPTLTNEPIPGSPVIGAGVSTFCPSTDQRGVARTRPCWIGSYQR